MATVAQLNVEIGARISGLTKGLRQAERELRQTARNFEDVGNQLTTSLSLGIAALGAGALRSFGQIEGLTKALEAQLGSGEAARAELEKLRELAKSPGIGFEQAVKGSVALQAVGDSAETARRELAAFGNALALAGKGAAELDGVTLALTQIKAKGIVSAEEINQIAERLPQIRTAMKAAFGTASTEEIQKLGITANQFVAGITAELEKLPKATGGFSNALTNFLDGLKISAAKVGEAINSSFNVTARIEAFGTWIAGLADAFAGLSDGTKELVLGIAAFALALGPAVRLTGLLVQGVLAMRNAFIALRIQALTAQVTGLVGWWQRLNVVMKANIIGAVIGVALAAAAAFALLSKDMSASAQAARAVADVNKTAAQNIAQEKVAVDLLVKTLEKETASREEKKKALADLKAISPQYFGQLTEEKGRVEGLTAAYNAYIETLLRSARAAAARERLVEIEKQLLGLSEDAGPSFWQGVESFFKSGLNSVTFFSEQAQTAGRNVQSTKAALLAQRDAMVQVIAQNEENTVADETARGKKELTDLQRVVRDATEDYTAFNRKLTEYGDISFSLTDRVGELQKIMDKLVESGASKDLPLFQQVKTDLDAANAALKTFNEQINFSSPNAPQTQATTGGDVLPGITGLNLGEQLTGLKPALAEAVTGFQALAAQIEAMNAGPLAEMNALMVGLSGQVGGIGAIALAGFSGLSEAMQEGTFSFAALGKAALKSAAEVAKGLIAQVALTAALKSIQSGGIFGAIAAVAIASAAIGGLTALVGSIKTPKLARGGLVYRPTTAIVGDNPNARFDPEVIAPLSKLKNILGGTGIGRQTDGFVAVAEVRGEALYFMLERVGKNVKRTRGY